VDSENAGLVTYCCPRCQTELDARQPGWNGWLRCPVCGMPSLPPELEPEPPSFRRDATVNAPNPDGDVTVASDEAERSKAVDQTPFLRQSAHTSPLRLVLITGLTLSLFLLLIAYVDQNRQTTAIFGFLSIAFFLALLCTPRKSGTRTD
jgi:hypothetical protein